MRVLNSLAFLLLLVPIGFAQQPIAQIEITHNDDDGLVSVGEAVTFTAAIRSLDEKEIAGTVEWLVHTVALDAAEPKQERIRMAPGDIEKSSYKFKMVGVGFADIECRLELDGNESRLPDARIIASRSRIGAAPEKLRSPLTKEPDFDEFWKASLAELGKVKPQFTTQLQTQPSPNETQLFEVSMRSFGQVRVRGWLEVPTSPGPHPVVIRVPGYGQNMQPIRKWTDMIVFSFNPRGHGNSQQDISGKQHDYWIRGLDDKETYYYRGAYLDCVRAVEYVCSRGDVDKKRIAVWGGSQGGGFAFATAALDSRVSLCVADIPFLCDWGNYFQLTKWPEMDKWIEKGENRTWQTTLRTMSYFDTMNLCDRISCPTRMGIGLQDQVCPPTTSFAAYNRIPGNKKQYRVYADRGHGLNEKHETWVWNEIRTEFGMPQEDSGQTSAE